MKRSFGFVIFLLSHIEFVLKSRLEFPMMSSDSDLYCLSLSISPSKFSNSPPVASSELTERRFYEEWKISFSNVDEESLWTDDDLVLLCSPIKRISVLLVLLLELGSDSFVKLVSLRKFYL